MQITKDQIADRNRDGLSDHRDAYEALAARLDKQGCPVEAIIRKLVDFQVAIPSWALGTGGTRFGRFRGAGEPRMLAEKIDDVGLLHALNRSSGAVSLHIPWDVPEDAGAVREQMQQHGLAFDAMNSNTFQDQPNQRESYKFGSLCHEDATVRAQAVAHNREVIRLGEQLGSKSLTVWLADGANFPGQRDLRRALRHTRDALRDIYAALPDDWTLLIEYKPFEPNFYSTVIPDWGTSYWLTTQVGERARTLVDLGHHLPNANIEQIVATLLEAGKLGGFHFNDSKYADDDLTVGSIKPYQLYLIFRELVGNTDAVAFMIDASHNTKDPLEDLLQSVEAIQTAYAQALLVDADTLDGYQRENDVVMTQELLQDAFRTDVRPLVREARVRAGGALDPLKTYRTFDVRATLHEERGEGIATGL
ncbi:MAG: TIM barrel protein [Catalinimonas sp.]